MVELVPIYIRLNDVQQGRNTPLSIFTAFYGLSDLYTPKLHLKCEKQDTSSTVDSGAHLPGRALFIRTWLENTER